MAYDGHIYNFTVQAINKDGRPGGVASAMSPPAQWKAVGKPASWGSWTLAATGENNQARATFTVPAARGEESRVNVYADGARVQQTVATGDTSVLVNVANNLGPHTVMLEICNEKNACSQSSTQNVQTYGPLAQGNIHSITPTIDVTKISWTIEVDSNGDAATVTVTSDRGRSEQFPVPVGVSSFTTQAIDFGYRSTENVTVTLVDSAPARGPVTATNGATTDPPPPPVVVASKGAACNDDPAAGLQPCNPGGPGGQNCTDASCAFVHIALSNWDVAGALVFCSINGEPSQPFDPYANTDTSRYFGTPGGTVSVRCNNSFQQADTTLTW